MLTLRCRGSFAHRASGRVVHLVLRISPVHHRLAFHGADVPRFIIRPWVGICVVSSFWQSEQNFCTGLVRSQCGSAFSFQGADIWTQNIWFRKWGRV